MFGFRTFVLQTVLQDSGKMRHGMTTKRPFGLLGTSGRLVFLLAFANIAGDFRLFSWFFKKVCWMLYKTPCFLNLCIYRKGKVYVRWHVSILNKPNHERVRPRKEANHICLVWFWDQGNYTFCQTFAKPFASFRSAGANSKNTAPVNNLHGFSRTPIWPDQRYQSGNFRSSGQEYAVRDISRRTRDQTSRRQGAKCGTMPPKPYRARHVGDKRRWETTGTQCVAMQAIPRRARKHMLHHAAPPKASHAGER